jgi:hypothetical protein
MTDKTAVEAQLARRLQMADKSPSMLNLSEELAIAAISHGIDISGFNSPETYNTEQAQLAARSLSNAVVDPATGEMVLMSPKGAPGAWVTLIGPQAHELAEAIPIHVLPSGDVLLDDATDWLRDMACALGWLEVQARQADPRPEFREVITPGTPLAERAAGRSWKELMGAVTNEKHARAVAAWLLAERDKKTMVQLIENQLEAA